jgi:hypothetical protein
MALVQFSCVHQTHHGRLCASRQELSFASSHPLALPWDVVRSIDIVTKKLHGALSRMIAVQHRKVGFATPLYFHSMHDVDLAHHQLMQFFVACKRDSSTLAPPACAGNADPLALSMSSVVSGSRRRSAAPTSADGGTTLDASPPRSAPTSSSTGGGSSSSSFGWKDIAQSRALMLTSAFLAFLLLVFVASTVDLLWGASRALMWHVISNDHPDDDRGGADHVEVVRQLASSKAPQDSSPHRPTSLEDRVPSQQSSPRAPTPAKMLPASWASRVPLDSADPGMAALLALQPRTAVETLRAVEMQLMWARVLLGVMAVALVLTGWSALTNWVCE